MSEDKQKEVTSIHKKHKKGQISRWHLYLTQEIGIEFKACLYFFAILFFYSVYRILSGSWDASIVHMAEMIFTTYGMGYLQVYLLSNFDEADNLGIRELGKSFVCSVVYVAISLLGSWFEREVAATLYFFFYMMLCYICVIWVYKIKRDIDTKKLNEDLAVLKERRREHEECYRD